MMRPRQKLPRAAAQRLQRAVVDALESRRLLAANLDINGILNVDATENDDTVTLSIDAGQLTVLLNTVADGGPFDLASITTIRLNGLGGNDNLSLAGTTISGTLDGGDGSDTLTGGSGNDTLIGGNGDDSFVSNDGAADTLQGNDGNDSAVADNTIDQFSSIEFGVPLPAAKIKVTTGGNPIDDGSVAAINFGAVTQRLPGPVIVFLVNNEGDDTLTVDAVTLPAGYSIIDPLSGPIAPGESDTFSIRLDTAIAGTKSGEVSFANSDPTQNPFNFLITGTVLPGADPVVSVLLARPSGPVDNGNTTIEFGNRPLDSTGPTRTFRVFNNGTAELTPGDITVPAGFTIIDPLVGPIAPGGGESFTIQLDTSTPGNYDGFISIPTNDPVRNPFTFRIIGVVGIDATPYPEITLNTVQNKQYRGVVSGSSNFSLGAATVGGTPTARTFRVVNNGAANLNLGKVIVPAGFYIVDPLVSVIKPGGEDTLLIGMATTTAGSKSGTVSFATNDTNENPFTFGVYGTVNPAISAGPAVTGSVAGGTLTVNGTPGIDTISLGLSSRGLSVVANSRSIAGSPFKGVARIVINGFDGDDRIVVGPINLPTTLLGGNGNDTLTGGDSTDYINGGAGFDVIDGGNGNDNLWGGTGNDVLTGGLGLDSMRGEDNNDIINATDGLSDALIDSGAGNDSVHKDRVDGGS